MASKGNSTSTNRSIGWTLAIAFVVALSPALLFTGSVAASTGNANSADLTCAGIGPVDQIKKSANAVKLKGPIPGVIALTASFANYDTTKNCQTLRQDFKDSVGGDVQKFWNEHTPDPSDNAPKCGEKLPDGAILQCD